jgi:outer membrane immunogenic protein
MRKLAITLFVLASGAGAASAADLPPAHYTKAPVAVAPVATWTGCYIGGGGGYGMWNQENLAINNPALVGATGPIVAFSETTTSGGRGYFGTVQGGCDYQFGLGTYQFVVGGFADGDWGSQKGTLNPPAFNIVGDEKLSSSWAVGGRVGWLAFPTLLTYFSGGYTEATFDRVDFHLETVFPPTSRFFWDKHTYKGWFVGAGDEYALGFVPGLFWKTEYRLSEFNRADNIMRDSLTALPTNTFFSSKKWDQTIRSELVYRFNWMK